MGFGDALRVLIAVVVGAALVVWLARRIVRVLRRLMPDRFFENHHQERNSLVLLALALSIAQAAKVMSSPTAVYGSTVELGLLGLLLVTVSAAIILPFVLLLSHSYRTELRQRFDVARGEPFKFEDWRSTEGRTAIVVAVLLLPIYLLSVGIPAAIAYLRGRAGTYTERRASRPGKALPKPQGRPQPRPAPQPIPQPQARPQPAPQPQARPRPAPREPQPGASRERPQARPLPAPTGPQRTGGPRTGSGQPEQPRRRWWQAAGNGDPDREPKFRTKSGGDEQTQMTARRRTEKRDDGKEYGVVEIGIQAAFHLPRANSPVVTVFELLDVTDAGRGPVAIHRWGEDVLHTGGPYRIEDQSTVPHASAVLTRTITVRLPALHAPYRGDRTVHARFLMHRPRTANQPLTQGWVEFPYREEAVGYVEAPQLRLRVEAGIATAGFAAVIADGEIDAAEMRLLDRFLAARHERVGDDGVLAGAARAALDEARMRARTGATARELLQQAGRDLADADDGPRESAYELAVQIMAVDGRITEDELARLNELAEVLDLSAETTAMLRNRHMKVDMYEGDKADPLGVPPGTPEEQRRFLREQLRTWRPVLTNPDVSKREQAQAMIDRITERIEEIDRARAGSA